MLSISPIGFVKERAIEGIMTSYLPSTWASVGTICCPWPTCPSTKSYKASPTSTHFSHPHPMLRQILTRNFIQSTTRNHQTTRTMATQNSKGQGVSHANDSSVPESIQKKAPKGLEDELPDSVHDTGSNSKTGKVSHATGDSKVPHALQEALPEKVERAVPNAIHDTSGLPPKK
jgi:hypothetical protein